MRNNSLNFFPTFSFLMLVSRSNSIQKGLEIFLINSFKKIKINKEINKEEESALTILFTKIN